MKSNLLLLLLITLSFAYTVPDSLREEAKWVNDKLIRCEFNAAQKYSNELLAKDSTQPLYYYLKLAALGLESLDREEIVREKEFHSTYKKGMSILKSDSNLENNSYLMMLKGFMETSLSSFYLIGGKYFSAMSIGQDGLKSVEKARALDPRNSDVDYYLGFFSYARGELKKRIPILFWLDDSSKEGIKELQRCSDNGLFMNRAADMVLVDVLVREGQLEKGAEKLNSMLNEYPSSRFLLWTKTRLETARDEKVKAADTFLELSQSYINDNFIHNALVTALNAIDLVSDNSEKQSDIANQVKESLNGTKIPGSEQGLYKKLLKYCKE